ncbi:hypothetical protein [Kitasatospora acidiphila]
MACQKDIEAKKAGWLREALTRLSAALAARALWAVITEHVHHL